MALPDLTAALRDPEVHRAIERDDPLQIDVSASCQLALQTLIDAFGDDALRPARSPHSATTIVIAAPIAAPLYIGPRNASATLGQDWLSVLAFARSTAVPVIELSTTETANDTSLIPVAPLVGAIERFGRRRVAGIGTLADPGAPQSTDAGRGTVSPDASPADPVDVDGGGKADTSNQLLSTMPDTMTTAEVAVVLRISVGHVRRLHRQGLIHATRRIPRGSSRLRFQKSEIARYLREIDGDRRDPIPRP